MHTHQAQMHYLPCTPGEAPYGWQSAWNAMCSRCVPGEMFYWSNEEYIATYDSFVALASGALESEIS